MMRWLYVARFFAVVPPMPLLMIGAFVIVTGIAGLVIVFDPRSATRALTPVLLLQLFACSSGFDVPARRGHYDLLMTSGGRRFQIVTAHWVASVLPGVVSWLVLGLICEAAAVDEQSVSFFTTGTVAAVGFVSTIPWAVTIRLPRFAGAIGWLLVITVALLIAPDLPMSGGEASVGDRTIWLQRAGAALVYPPLLVGARIGVPDTFVVLPGGVLAVSALAVAFRSAIRRDIPLEAAQ